MQVRTIAVGVCTFRRPEQLARCLQSLAALDRPDAAGFCIIIADNDPEGSARPVVERFREGAGCGVYYAVEVRRGIPFARNNIIERAVRLGITDLACIDDDEYVYPGWLVTLWDRYVSSGADVMAGYVETVYPAETPRWIIEGKFFQNAQRPAGTPLSTAATGNVVFNVQKLAVQWGLRFDERFGLAGGSDTDFFYRAARQGAVMMWTADAPAYEELARERMRLSYLLKNRFRKSNLKPGYALLTIPQKTALFLGLLKKIIMGVLVLPVSLVRGFSRFAGVLNDTVAAIANMLALLGWRFRWDEYTGSSERNAKPPDS
ncbi:MAG: glycosyltransferase family 2 protein [Deltaproteobacteria bacterium]|nr:glycosyltransferase family 2 protein [Deltaproteobacteria bacterium]